MKPRHGAAGERTESHPAEVAAWTAECDETQERIRPRFARSEQRQRVWRYVGELLSPVERKNGWQLAEHAGDVRSFGMQRLLAGAKWDADAVCDDLRVHVLEHFGDPHAVLVINETGWWQPFSNKGRNESASSASTVAPLGGSKTARLECS
jgi:SRSO17 transposase